jgi:tetratricopeptide (TPR) repeat protein
MRESTLSPGGGFKQFPEGLLHMDSENKENQSLDPQQYLLWTPGPGRTVASGADRHPVSLPRVPLPIHRSNLQGEEPTDEAVGRGCFDYLRQFPDCPENCRYAELLRDAFPHYLADIGAQTAMLDKKEVDAPYVLRMLANLKIFALLDPENPRLLQALGRTCYDLALMFAELPRCRYHLLKGMGYFQRSLKVKALDPTSLNYLGQIDYLLGDYPAAVRRWQGVIEMVENEDTRKALSDKIVRIETGAVPDHPLVDDLEAIGAAMELFAAGSILEATTTLEILEEQGTIREEFPSAEFYYLLGMCREKGGDAAGAFEAFEKALELNPGYEEALEGKNRILEGKGI